ncbi:MAG: AI-2E family transporter [Deltaproteobacteria bacterium]|nr:AI-2E family transporter [Deltaproteobacteria bacterium]
MDGKVFSVPVAFITAAAFVIIVAGMQVAAPIIIPFLLALFLATLCSPPLFWLLRHKVPNGLAVLVIMVGLVVVTVSLMIFAGRSLNSLTQQLPAYQERLLALINHFVIWLNSQGLRIDMNKLPLDDYFNPRMVLSLVTYGLSVLRILFTNLFLILLIVFFILLEASGFPQKLRDAFPNHETLEHFKAITANVNRYMGFKALFSLATGVLIWLLLALIGVDFAGTWGLLAFFLNFIPSIGSIIAAVPAIFWALVQLGVPSALLTLLAYLVVNIAIGNFLEPRYVGRRLGLSTLVVIISMFFWGWVLGPIGMLLSVPLTMVVKIALASKQDTRWMAVMLE